MSKKLTASLHGFYVKNGKNVYRYLVNRDKEALASYEEAQGTNFRAYENQEDPEDKLNGTPLFFSPRPEGKNISLEITPNGKVVVSRNVEDVMTQDLIMQDKVQSELAKIMANQQAIRMKIVGQS